jgi:D-lyxose ketol-isomerase
MAKRVKATPKKKEKREVLVYCGERVPVFSAKVLQLFKDAKGNKYHYSGIKGVYVGECYAAIDEQMKIRPEIVPPEEAFALSTKDRIEAEAQMLIVRDWRAERKKAMELKRPHANITRAIDLLRPFYLGLNDLDRRRFAGYLRNEMSKRKRKK